MKIKLPNSVIKAIEKIELFGYQAYVVGGSVRDSILGLKARDFDIATNASIEKIKEIFEKTVQSGKGHDTIGVISDDLIIDVTKFRSKAESNSKERLLNDLKMRDFTINSMAYDHKNDFIIDPFDSINNLTSKIVMIKSNEAEKRFKEDPLRMLRAISLGSRLQQAKKEWKIEAYTKKAILKMKDLLNSVAKERINKELSRILISKNISPLLLNMNELGLIKVIFPYFEIKNLKSVIKILQSLPNDLPLRLSGIFIDTKIENAYKNLSDLRYSKKIINRVIKLLKYVKKETPTTDYEIRKTISEFGSYDIFDLINLKKSYYASINKEDHSIKNFETKCEYFIKNNYPLEIKDLDINGEDIVNIFNIQGEIVGKMLKTAFDMVLKNPEFNKKNLLIEKLKTGRLPGF